MNSSLSDPRKARQVLLFSGHMIDAANRRIPRFPPQAEPLAAEAIEQTLEDLRVGPEDLGITQGACGADLIFAEKLLARGGALALRLPFREPEFRKRSLVYPKKKPPTDRWLRRFLAVRDHPRVSLLAMPDATQPLPRNLNPYERCNLWMLREVLSHPSTRVRFICLWNGAKGDGPGGTAHMRQAIRHARGKVIWLDSRKLWRA